MNRSRRRNNYSPAVPGCGVQIGKSNRANPSPNGRGWPAPAGRVRGTASIKAILFICTPHPPLRGTLPRWERDSQIHTSDSENHRLLVRSIDRNLGRPACSSRGVAAPPYPVHSHPHRPHRNLFCLPICSNVPVSRRRGNRSGRCDRWGYDWRDGLHEALNLRWPSCHHVWNVSYRWPALSDFEWVT